MHWRAQQKEPWPGRGTKGRARCQPYCWPVADEPPVPTEPHGDGGVFSTAATEPLVIILGDPLEDPIDGALLLFKADDTSIPERFARDDPYVKEGLVKQWPVRGWSEASIVLSGEAARS